MNEHDKRPPEEQIEALLEGWQPLPSARLQQRVADLPWNQRSKPMKRSRRMRWAGAMAAVLALLIGVTLSVPSLRATAAELLGFANEKSDTTEKTVTFVGPPALQGSVAAVEAQAGFHVREPTYLPSGFVFNKAMYSQYSDGKRSLVQYQSSGGQPAQRSMGIVIEAAQWRYDPHAKQIAVGASANIENVSINGFAGQYVKGMWVPAPGTCDQGCGIEKPTPAPGDTENMRFQWNADVSIYVVRWQEGDMVYQVLASGDQFTKDEVLKIAQSLR